MYVGGGEGRRGEGGKGGGVGKNRLQQITSIVIKL